jgi:hypothetical protein
MQNHAATPEATDQTFRFNAALLARGRRALTGDPTDRIALLMLRDALQALGMAMTCGNPEEAGHITATIIRPAGSRGERVIATSARTGRRWSSVVEAAIAALKAPPPGWHSVSGGVGGSVMNARVAAATRTSRPQMHG